MKNLYYSLYALFFISFSCTGLEQLSNQGQNTRLGKQSFEIKANKIMLEARLDSVSYQWRFDSGSTLSGISDTIGLKNKKVGKIPIVGAKLPDGNKFKEQFVTGNIENGFMSIKNKAFLMTPQMKPDNDCGEISGELTYTPKGIIGWDVFSNNDESFVELNFDKNEISTLSKSDFNSRVKDGYKPAEATFDETTGHIYLPVKVGQKTYKFLFDTGYTGTIMPPFADKENLKSYHSMEMEGSFMKTLGGTVSDDRAFFAEDADVLFAGNPMKITTQSFSRFKEEYKNVGMIFIRNFNWLIDFNNEKVYIKPVIQKPENLKFPSDYKVRIINNKIFIIARNIKNTEYPVNAEITSVNDVLVNKENKCQILKQLNDTKDWKTLKLEIKKPN